MSKVIQLPISGAGLDRLFGGGPSALDDQGTTRIFLGQAIDIAHSATGTRLTYILRDAAGASETPASEYVYEVFPDDYDASTNNVYWSLESIRKYGNPALWNKDIDGGNGGFNTQKAEGQPAQLKLLSEEILASAFN